MSVTLLTRERGAILRCNCPGCPTEIQTGQIQKGLIRAYAATLGWGRGLRRSTRKAVGNRRRDYCPVHYARELADAAERKATRDARREKRWGRAA